MNTQQHLQAIKGLSSGKKVVFVGGFFNIIHPGHLRLLRFAAECGHFLVVGVYPDSFGKPMITEEHRLEGVKSNCWVDYGFLMDETTETFISKLKPDVVVKGEEHENQDNPELSVLKSYGGKLVFSSGDVTFSSIDLLRSETENFSSSPFYKPEFYAARHDFVEADLKKIVMGFNELKVLVIGDTIVDEYIACDPVGMSQEDPTIVVRPVHTDRFVGAAAIVAAHAAGLGATVNYFSVTGADEMHEYVGEKLQFYNVNSNLYKDESRKTTVKQRFRAAGKTLLRVNHLNEHSINRELIERVSNDVIQQLDNTDLLIFSDFNYGCLPQVLVDILVEECRNRGVMMVADSQSSSQVGDVSRFKGMSLVTPTEREARIATNDYHSGLVILAESLQEKSGASFILLTLGEEGLVIHSQSNKGTGWLTDKLPALNPFPKDVSGAGDSLLTCASMALVTGADIWQSAYLGSIAAGCQVARIGNSPLKQNEILSEIL